MTQELSLKIKTISFFLILLVIYSHSNNVVIKLSTGNIQACANYSSYIQLFLCDGLARITSPLFFAISGFLFFLNFNGKIDEYTVKVKSRTKSLLIPYLFWSVSGILILYILQLIPHTSLFFTKELIRNFSVQDFFNALLINPIPYQLWFVKDLIVLILIAPLVYSAIKFLKIYFVLLLVPFWLFEFDFVLFDCRSILFFVFGSYLALSRKNILKINLKDKTLIFCFLWLFFVTLKTTIDHYHIPYEYLSIAFRKISILFGILSVWSAFDYFAEKKSIKSLELYRLSSFSFFLFASHEPVLTIFKKGLLFLLGKGEFISLAVFIVAPLLTIFTCLAVGYFFRRMTPEFYRIITGGR